VRRALALALIALAALAALPGTAAARDRWNTRVLALVPKPGFPAMAYVAPNGRIYEGTYDNPNGDSMASRVLEYDGDGTLLRSWTITGQDLSKAHGVQVATSDGAGNLLLLDKSPPRVLQLNPRTSEQTTRAVFPDGSIPNYAAWGPDGSLYITDYGKPIVWRIAPGASEPKLWLTDPQLDGGMFGTTGIALAADRHTFIVGQQSEAGGNAGNPSTGRLFKVEIKSDGSPGPLTQLWESQPVDGPDGFAIAKSGNIYVALLAANQIGVVGPDGVEKERFPAAPGGANGSSVPFDSPSSVRFLGTRLIVANQSYFSGDPTHQAILDVESGEEGLPELVPPAPVGSTAPVQQKQKKTTKRKPKRKHRRHHKHRRHRHHRG
jgi:sugar lactone lactonase YvrE